MKKIKQLKFTLMEVTVAFGIFAILVAVLMQFMNTAQRAWNLSEKRSRAYADSRIFFDLVDKALKNSYIEGFYYNTSGTQTELVVPCMLPYRFNFHAEDNTRAAVNNLLDLNVKKVRNLRINYVLPPPLPTSALHTDNGSIRFIYPKLGWNGQTTPFYENTTMLSNIPVYSTRDYSIDVIIDNVADFSIVKYNNNFQPITSSSNISRPAFIMITLRMFGSYEDYAVWRTLSPTSGNITRDNYLRENGFYFSRLFALPDGNNVRTICN